MSTRNENEMDKRLPKVETALAEAASLLEEIVTERVDYASDKSERWHESDNGTEFVAITEKLEGALDSANEAMSAIEAEVGSTDYR